jgi:hypothetical protein
MKVTFARLLPEGGCANWTGRGTCGSAQTIAIWAELWTFLSA